MSLDFAGATTRPPAPKRGMSSPGCYAAEFSDCDGGPCNREHYVSKSMLELFGAQFEVSGASWADVPRRASPKTLWAPVLCERHNTALSPVDQAGVALFQAFRDYHCGKDGDDLVLDGDMLERWPLKAAAGLISSGHALWKEGASAPRPKLPRELAEILFDETEMPEGCGLQFVASGSALPRSFLLVHPLTHPSEHERAGVLYAAVCGLLGTPFMTCIEPLPPLRERVWRRPAGLLFGSRRVTLNWRRSDSTEWITLLVPRGMGGAI